MDLFKNALPNGGIIFTTTLVRRRFDEDGFHSSSTINSKIVNQFDQ